jgi:hypothetical protein
MSDVEHVDAPPAGEEIHMPGPSILPFLNAVGLTVAILGVTTHWVVLLAGALLFLFTAAIWVRDTRRDIEHLPLDHHH